MSKLVRPKTDEEISRTPCGVLFGAAGRIVGRYFTFAGFHNIECYLCDFEEALDVGEGWIGDLNEVLRGHVKTVHPGK